VRTSQPPKVETPNTQQEPIVAGNQVTSTGAPLILSQSSAIEPKEKTFTEITVMGVVTDSSNNAFNELGTGGGLTSTFEVAGNKLIKVNKSGATSTTWTPASGATVTAGALGNVTDTNFLGWGSWSQTTKEEVSGSTTVTPLKYFHYVAGRPTAVGDMPTSGTATYNFAGGSSPTRINGGGTTVGSINAANTFLSVNFGTSTLTANIDTSIVTINDTATISGALFSGAYVNGFFTGTGASRAGLTFKKSLTAGDVVTGAIAFTKQ
jgi:hypothetical protein